MAVAVKSRPALDIDPGIAEFAALGVGNLALAGSLYLSVGMGLTACAFCLYERTFLMAVLALLAGGRILKLPVQRGTMSLMAFPLSLGGLGVSLIHTNLVRAEVLACPNGILGLGPAPVQSMVAFLLLTALLIPGMARSGVSPIESGRRAVASVVLGVALAAIAVVGAPAVPPFNPTFNEAGIRVLNTCERAQPEPIMTRR